MALTPMMRQYFEIKEKNQDCILFYRLGDFYEMFFEDAKVASRELELVLTGRDCGMEERAPMCGIPFHAAPNYVSRLVAKGYKIAICEQVEEASASKGIVKRDVVKVITPGTYLDLSGENQYKNIYIMTLHKDQGLFSIATSDISTGEFKTTTFESSLDLLLGEISKFSPKELIISDTLEEGLVSTLESIEDLLITRREETEFISDLNLICEQFTSVNVDELHIGSAVATTVLLNYIFHTQKTSLSNINFLETYNIVDYMTIDSNSRRNLELAESIKEKSKKGSLLWVLDKTKTSMGSRTLRGFIEQPLIQRDRIESRNSAVEELIQNGFRNEDLRELLSGVYDIERITGKIANNNVNARDLISLKNSLDKLPLIKEKLSCFSSPLLKNWGISMDLLEDVKVLLEKAIKDEPPITVKEGNIIRENYSKEVDEFRDIKSHGKEWIATLEQKEREFTGIKSLKVGYNKVFGYYIEISKANYSSIPEGRYIRKQTLSNAERYITEELKVMEDKILGAEDKLVALEYNLFMQIRDSVEKEIPRLKETGKVIGTLDVITTLAYVAQENNYIKPQLNEDGIIQITDGRHPVVEKVLQSGEFVGNDTNIDNNGDRLLLITGPNMAGKSTYMRQVALISIMAQIGSFVPASYANISICDKIFTRIGASDDLAGGKSTFMVEMWEVSNILKNATNKSLVLLDEVGRGTSTYDGLSIAWSVIEYISKKEDLKCNTLFATHYHELTNLEGIIEGVKNYSVAVKEIGDEVIFLRKIVEGGADQSYGIEVAKIAGLPTEVIERAKEILGDLENKKDFKVEIKEQPIINKTKKRSKDIVAENIPMQIDFTTMEKTSLIEKIKSIEVMTMTPMDAMNELYKLIQEAKSIR